MTITLLELCDKLKELDELTLLEKLDVTSEEIVPRFIDLIEEDFDALSIEYGDDEDE